MAATTQDLPPPRRKQVAPQLPKNEVEPDLEAPELQPAIASNNTDVLEEDAVPNDYVHVIEADLDEAKVEADEVSSENYPTKPCERCDEKGFEHLSDMIHMIQGQLGDRDKQCFFCTKCLECSGSGAVKDKEV